jgi:hypothetical protein
MDKYCERNNFKKNLSDISNSYYMIKHNSNIYNNYSYKKNTNEKQQEFEFEQAKRNWDLLDSTIENSKISKANSTTSINLLMNTPRILELDINRMMISQNRIS